MWHARKYCTNGSLGSREGAMPRFSLSCCALIAAAAAWASPALAGGQIMPGGAGQMPGGGRPTMGVGPPDESPPQQATEKPDIAPAKAYKQAMKSLDKAKELEAAAASASNADKKAKALEKLDDAYNRALDQFTEALSNKGDMVEAWNYAGYVHLRLGAYRESIDDYNHTLTLKPDLLEAAEGRGEAYVGVDRLEEAKAT